MWNWTILLIAAMSALMVLSRVVTMVPIWSTMEVWRLAGAAETSRPTEASATGEATEMPAKRPRAAVKMVAYCILPVLRVVGGRLET